jgi:hypothetical protein
MYREIVASDTPNLGQRTLGAPDKERHVGDALPENPLPRSHFGGQGEQLLATDQLQTVGSGVRV